MLYLINIIKNYIKYDYKPKKVQSPLTNTFVYDLETYIKDRAVPYCSFKHKLCKDSGKNNQDKTEKEYQKCLNECVVSKGSGCFNDMLDHVLSVEGEAKEVKTKNVEFNLFMIAQNGSGFDSYVVLNNLPQWRSVVKIIKNGAGIISVKTFNGCVDENKKVPQSVQFRFGRVHNSISLKKINVSYKLQTSLLKQEVEISENTWESRGNELMTYVKNDVLSTTFCYDRYIVGIEEFTNFGMKNSLISSSLANKFFNSSRKESDEAIFVYTDPFMRNFLRNSIKSGRYIAFNQHYKSEFSHEVFNTNSKKLNVKGNICDLPGRFFEFPNNYEKFNANEFHSKFEE